jgi:hypothetical protein
LQNALKHVKQSFTWSKVADSIHEIYNYVMEISQPVPVTPARKKAAETTPLQQLINLLPDTLLPGFKNSIV